MILVLLTGLVAVAQNPEQSPPLHLTTSQTKYNPTYNLEYLEDPTTKLTIEQIASAEYAAKFNANTTGINNFGLTDSVYWFRLTVNNQAPNVDWLWEISFPSLIKVYFYQPTPTGEFIVQKTGYVLPYQDREILHYNFVFKLDAPSQVATYYLRVDNSAMSVPMNIWESQTFYNKTAGEYLGWGIFFGSLIIMILYNLVIAIVAGDRIYAFYSAVLLTISVFMAGLSGLGNIYVWANWPLGLRDHIIPFTGEGITLMLLLFTARLLNTKKFTPHLHNSMVICSICVGVLMIVTALPSPGSLIIGLWFVMTAISIMLMISSTVLIVIRNNYEPAIYYLGAWAGFLVANFYGILIRSGLVKPVVGISYETVLQISTIFMILMLSLGLAARIRLLRKATEAANRQLRESQETLEIRVQERTQTLNQTLADLQAEKHRAEQANRAKDLFLANMSHELRTPLNAVLGYAQILQRTYSHIPEIAKSSRVIRSSGEHLLGLLNDVLDIARIETGQISLDPEPIKLADYLGSITDASRPQAQQKQQTLVYHATSPLPDLVLIDARRLRQVLNNLLQNALKFTPSGGEIILRATVGNPLSAMPPATKDSCYLHIEVCDNGPGIPGDQLANIFQPFQQGEQPAVRDKGGTGLGLAISQELIGLMQGKLKVESTLAQGSRFWFEIPVPVINASPATTQPQKTTTITDYLGERKLILLVDDISQNLALLKSMLTDINFEVSSAAGGQEALEQIQQNRPDLILLDWYMPNHNGDWVISQLQQNPQTASIPIVVISAGVFSLEVAEIYQKSITAFVDKPVKMEKLISVMGKALGLTWVSEAIDVSTTPESLVVPNHETLKELLALAKLGNMRKLETELQILNVGHPEYQPFTRKLLTHTQKFNDAELMTLLENYLAQ